MSAPAEGGLARADDGFESFLRAHRDPLLGFLRKRTGAEDAADALQETLIRLMRYRGQPAEQLRPLMYRIALNVLADRARRNQSRQADAHVSFDLDFEGLPSAELAHEQRVDHQQALQQVRAAILQLPPRCRQVYLLNRIDGMSYPQIARHCDISVKAVEKHVSKALRLLRASLEPQPDSTPGQRSSAGGAPAHNAPSRGRE
ncbi:MAG: RNA polymerase sigma factor [Pseudomonadota bacterium]|nr:RNA polymerase sigma factor [Pseudomonadota bacterium]